MLRGTMNRGVFTSVSRVTWLMWMVMLPLILGRAGFTSRRILSAASMASVSKSISPETMRFPFSSMGVQAARKTLAFLWR